ncbi:MAG: ParB/RepB/Spo0J family partition protein [Alphaproteobacteria bacterium]
MAKKPAKSSPLGQGLASLLGAGQENLLRDDPISYDQSTGMQISGSELEEDTTAANTVSKAGLAKLPTDLLIQGKYQPRRQFDQTALEELSNSIQNQGLLQPIIVRPHENGGYEIVAGERRWRAALLAGLHEVPVVIKDLDDRTTLELSILENVQRLDLSALEEAQGYQRLMDEFGHRQEDLAKIMGKSRSYIANSLRLLSLPDGVSSALDKGKISAGHARTLLGAVDANALIDDVIEMNLSVRETETLVKKQKAEADKQLRLDAPGGSMGGSTGGSTSGAASGSGSGNNAGGKIGLVKDPDTRALEQTIESRLGLKVEFDIDPKSHGEAGKLIITYKSLDQLDTVLARFR